MLIAVVLCHGPSTISLLFLAIDSLQRPSHQFIFLPCGDFIFRSLIAFWYHMALLRVIAVLPDVSLDWLALSPVHRVAASVPSLPEHTCFLVVCVSVVSLLHQTASYTSLWFRLWRCLLYLLPQDPPSPERCALLCNFSIAEEDSSKSLGFSFFQE